ncbi:MAG: GntR family transcriptional regulator [Balneolales bacterium]|nr:GntR family transcriptional regulator [Balneolales bacterium]
MKTSKHIADRIRLLIATRQFQVGEVLPSTRELGKQLDSSFHTVRKAYQLLASEGLLKSEQGRGFVVSSSSTLLDKSERLEKGAEKFRELLEELIGYGLDEEEVETLFQEQLNFLDWPERFSSCAAVGPSLEIAQMYASTIKRQVGVRCSTLLQSDKEKALNYDALIVPLSSYQNFTTGLSDLTLIPVSYQINFDLLLSLAEKPGLSSLSVIAVERKSLDYLLPLLQQELPENVEILPVTLDGASLPSAVYKSEIVLYTDSCSRIAEHQLTERRRRKIEFVIPGRSSEMIRSQLWEDF